MEDGIQRSIVKGAIAEASDTKICCWDHI